VNVEHLLKERIPVTVVAKTLKPDQSAVVIAMPDAFMVIV
jgi:hypothetical protein